MQWSERATIGKPSGESVRGRRDSPDIFSPIFVHSVITNGTDNRPLAIIRIDGKEVHCLLDSGSNRSIVGSAGMEMLKELGYRVDQSQTSVIYTATTTPSPVSGSMRVPCDFKDRVKVIEFLACPSISHSFILGVDFWSAFEVQVQNVNGIWHCNSIEVLDSDKRKQGIVELEHLSQIQRALANRAIEQFKSLANDNRLGRTRLFYQEIDTGDSAPTVQRHYPVSPAVQQRMSNELDRMISLGVVERSRSPWRSPVVLVKKANGKDRLCIDCRKVNSVTKFDSYPLPYVSSILDNLGQTKYLSSVDLKDAFWQIPLSESAKEKTAFVVPGRGLWQMKVVPFGMKNSAQAMQRLVDMLFSGEHGVFTYLDDIIIVTETFEEHIRLLELVHARLVEANLTINYDKCQFFRPSLKYLGFIVDVRGLHTDPDKVQAINDYPCPKTSTEVKRFVGMASWYRRFIKDFASISAPIHDVTAGISKGKPIKWTEGADKAFQDLKSALSNSPVLTTPDFSKPFTVHCDASNSGVGAVLTQGAEEAPIAFASKKLSHEHRNYTATERECFAVLFGVEKFRPYIEGAHFTVVTDHSSLKWLFNQQNLPGRLSRWVTKLMKYSFTTIHRKGSSNLVPDALSRIYEQEQKADDATANTVRVNAISSSFSWSELCVLDCDPKESDEWYNTMLARFGKSTSADDTPFFVRNGQLYFKATPLPGRKHAFPFRKVVPESWKSRVMDESHAAPSAGHLGVSKTKARICQRYFWPKMGHDIERYVRSCGVCLQSKSRNGVKNQGLMGKFKFANAPFQMISMDFIGPLTSSSQQNTVILVITDWFSKFVSLFPLRRATAAKVVEVLERQIFLQFGVPEVVIMDNGKQFVSKELMALFEKYRIRKIWYNSFYHPQNNFTERYNRTIGNCLRAFVGDNQRKWDVALPMIQLALRTAVHATTGFTPYFLNYGREYVAAGNDYSELSEGVRTTQRQYSKFLEEYSVVANDVQERMRRAYDRNKSRYDQNRKQVDFAIGDLIYRRNFALSNASQHISAKLLPKYVPLYILRKTSDSTFDLGDENGRFVGNYHVKDFFKPTP